MHCPSEQASLRSAKSEEVHLVAARAIFAIRPGCPQRQATVRRCATPPWSKPTTAATCATAAPTSASAEFVELFWWRWDPGEIYRRRAKPNLPRAMDEAFLADPRGDDAQTIARYITEWRERQALESQRIANDKMARIRGWLDDLTRPQAEDRDPRIYPAWYAPTRDLPRNSSWSISNGHCGETGKSPGRGRSARPTHRQAATITAAPSHTCGRTV